MVRRNNNTNPMSLFSFQDIITATTGILILLALVLALSVIIQGAQADVEIIQADSSRIAYRDSLSAEVDLLKNQSKELEEETSTWSSATPAELNKKLKSANTSIDQLNDRIDKAKGQKKSAEASLASSKSNTEAAQVLRQIQDLEQQIRETSTELAALQNSNRVVYNFRQNSKSPWLVEISGDRILAARVGTKSPPRSFNSPIQFNKFAASRPIPEQYFVLVVKPSGVSWFDELKRYLEEQSMDAGVELIGEDQVAIDPLKGVGF